MLVPVLPPPMLVLLPLGDVLLLPHMHVLLPPVPVLPVPRSPSCTYAPTYANSYCRLHPSEPFTIG